MSNKLQTPEKEFVALWNKHFGTYEDNMKLATFLEKLGKSLLVVLPQVHNEKMN